MRGRTNILGGGGGAVVNGQIKDFKVADGNNISVGDFVTMISGPASYYDVQNYSFDLFGESKVFKISNSKCALFYGVNIMILDLSNGIVLDKIISGTFHTVRKQNVYQIDSNHFAILYNESSTSISVDVVEVDYENNTSSFDTKIYNYEESVAGYSDIYYFAINVGNIIFLPYSKSSSKIFSIIWIDVNSGEFGRCDVSNSSNVDYFLNNGCLVNGEEGFLYVFSTGLNNTSPKSVYVSKLYFSSEEKSLTLLGQYSIYTEKVHKYIRLGGTVCYLGNNNFALSTSTGIEILKIEDNITQLNFIQGIRSGLIFNYDDYLLLFEQTLTSGTGHNQIVYYGVISINDITTFNSIELQQFSFVDIFVPYAPDTYTLGLLDFENKFIVYGFSRSSSSTPARFVECKLENENIVGMDSENYVTSYNGKALGFAKTGGNAGDTIKVYVPYDNN